MMICSRCNHHLEENLLDGWKPSMKCACSIYDVKIIPKIAKYRNPTFHDDEYFDVIATSSKDSSHVIEEKNIPLKVLYDWWLSYFKKDLQRLIIDSFAENEMLALMGAFNGHGYKNDDFSYDTVNIFDDGMIYECVRNPDIDYPNGDFLSLRLISCNEYEHLFENCNVDGDVLLKKIDNLSPDQIIILMIYIMHRLDRDFNLLPDPLFK